MGSKRRRSFAPSSYSPLDADAADAPELPRVERAWRDAARSFVRRLHLGLSRRWRPASRGRRFDLRRTLRAGLQTGGEALSPRWLRRPRRAPRFVLLVDGSRSMSAYARTALQMAVAMASATMRIEVFTFSTRTPARDRRGAASGGGGAAPSRSPASCVGGRHQHRRVPSRLPAAVRRAHGGTRHRRDDRERRTRRRRAGHAARRDARAAPAVGRRGVAESAPRDGGVRADREPACAPPGRTSPRSPASTMRRDSRACRARSASGRERHTPL